jgi:signal transduction histidine kinase
VTRRLVATYLILAAVVLAALEVPLGIVNARGQRHDLQQRVERDAVAVAALVEDALQAGSRPGDPTLVRTVRRYADRTGARVVVVGEDGTALADSDDQRELGRDFSTRPEIARALDGAVATGTRHSETLGGDLLYVAVPVASGGTVQGAVRISVPTSRLDALVRRYWLILGAVALIVLGVVALAGLWLARWVSRPLTDLRDATRRTGAGDLSVRAGTTEGPAEVRELASSFNDMVRRLEQLVGTQEKFVADASHQLRSPLTALRLRIENLQYEAPAAADEFESALAEVDRLSRLVDGLLVLARAERTAHRRVVHDIGAVVRERADAWRDAAAERGVAIDVDVAPFAAAALAPGALEQILDNLIANALEFAPPESAVSLVARRDAAVTVIEVADRGPGMSPQERAQAFDRFWRGQESRPGSGLGLAIVKSLVEAEDGSVALQDRSGEGLRAVIRLPAADAPAGEPERPISAR